MKQLLLFPFLLTIVSGCYDIDEEILPVVGIYRAHIVGVAGPFDLVISTAGGDDVIIEAPFDGDFWYTVRSDIENQDERIMDFRIGNQQIDRDINMRGKGFFVNNTIELRYTIDYGNESVNFKIVGTKL